MNRCRLLALLALIWALPVSGQDWGEIAQISTTLGVQANRLCLGEGSRGDIGCPSYAPYVSPSSGYLGIGTTGPQSALHVNGALRVGIDGSQTAIWLPSSGALRTGTSGANTYFDVGTAWFRDGTGSNTNAGVRIAGNIGVGVGISTPSTTLHTIGSLRLGIETSTTMNTCDANRAGAIRWHEGAGQFQVCYGSGGWALLSSAATSGTTATSDRITSETSAVIANGSANGGYISLTAGVGGTEWGYLGSSATYLPRLNVAAISVTTNNASFTTLYASGNVGIGTSNPSQRLTLFDSTNATISFRSGSGTPGSTREARIAAISTGGGGNGHSLAFFTNDTGGAPFEYMRLTPDGKLGIGTSVPSTTLHVSGSLMVNNGTAAGLSAPHLYVSGTTGRVGLGTNSPATNLDVYGVAAHTENVASTAGSLIVRGSDITPALTTKGILDIEQSGSNAAQGAGATLTFSNNNWQFGTSYSRVGGAIKVGLDSAVNQDPTSHMAFSTTGFGSVLSERMRITNGGYVGIGANVPSTTLHVSGTLRIANGGDTCDANRAGAIRWHEGAGQFQVCYGSGGWALLSSAATSGTTASVDRITSGTAAVIANGNSNSISITESGVTTGYYYNGIWVAGGVSTTGAISSTKLYVSDSIGIATTATPIATLQVSGTGIVVGPSAAGKFGLLRHYNGNFYLGGGVSNQVFYLGSNTDATRVYSSIYYDINGNAAGGHYFRSNGGTIMSLTSATDVPRVGINTSTPSATLHVTGNFLATSWTYLNANPSVRVTPTAPLEVSGTVSATNFVGNGSGLTNISASAVSMALNDLTDAATAATNVFLGHEGGSYGNNDTENTATGIYALDYLDNTTAVGNSAFGFNALTTNQSGDNNSAFGRYTLNDNRTGIDNSAFGAYALQNNITGSQNTAIGRTALHHQENSAGQTAVGYDAMRYISGTSADVALYNTALGFSALRGSTTPDNNTGDQNTAIGYSALVSNTSGSYNTAIGTQSLYNTTTGSQNTALGRNAGYGLVTGSSNILIGYGADTPANNTSNFLNIGSAISGTYTTGGVINFLAGIKSAGVVTATYFEGDGSRLTNLATTNSDRIVSGTTSVVAYSVGGISATTDLEVSGTVKIAGTGSEPCGPALRGTIRQNPVTMKLEVCRY